MLDLIPWRGCLLGVQVEEMLQDADLLLAENRLLARAHWCRVRSTAASGDVHEEGDRIAVRRTTSHRSHAVLFCAEVMLGAAIGSPEGELTRRRCNTHVDKWELQLAAEARRYIVEVEDSGRVRRVGVQVKARISPGRTSPLEPAQRACLSCRHGEATS